MARRPSSSRRSSASKSSNPLPIILGGVAILIAIIGFVVFGGSTDDKKNDSASKEAKSTVVAKKKDDAPKKKAKLIDGKTKAEWRALRKKVDMKLWKDAEVKMAEALKLRQRALSVRKEDESKYKEQMREGLKLWRKARKITADFGFKVDRVDELLWDNAFDREAKQLQNWNKKFRGYMSLEKK